MPEQRSNNSVDKLKSDIKKYIRYVCRAEGYDKPSDILQSCFLGEFFSIGPNTLPLMEEYHHCLMKFLLKKYSSVDMKRFVNENVDVMNNYITDTFDRIEEDELLEDAGEFDNDEVEWITIRKYSWCYVYNMFEEELDRCV